MFGSGRLTAIHVSGVNHARRQRQEQNAILLVLRAELGNGHVQRRLADRVQRSDLNVESVDHVRVGVAAAERNDLLCLALEDEREEDAEEVDLADHVDAR